ncbi:hypothetical protein RHSIM_Rhsim11G0152100 [Rhododendron simsii]|uniref:Uncharacterized protein n=1 Tax=Rhododendron simsii TaxID=118357 RepID=A0A834G556_RHOSS|nr:hypothetical protein RHSIM_Rhsim11G0152100 [Rhododendron simsii]
MFVYLSSIFKQKNFDSNFFYLNAAAAIPPGFQHYVVMLGTTVIIPSIIVPLMGGGQKEKAEVIQTSLFVTGLNTLLQTWFGTRLPVVIGPSYSFIAPALFTVLSERYSISVDPLERFEKSMRGIQGAMMIASIIPILLGFFGIWRIIVRLITPVSAVPLVTLVGLGLYAQGFPQLRLVVNLVAIRYRLFIQAEFSNLIVPMRFDISCIKLAECIEIGLPELIILIILSQYIPRWIETKTGERFFYRYAVLLSIAIVWLFAALLTASGAYRNKSSSTQVSCRVDQSGLISGAAWISVPYPWQWGTPSVDAGDVFVMIAAALVALIESTGANIAAARFGSATLPPPSIFSRGAGWLVASDPVIDYYGIGWLLDGSFGTASGSTVSVENVGLLALSRSGSRRVVQISAGFMLLFAVFGKFGAILASIPLPIFAALQCISYAYETSAGLGLLQLCNINKLRTKFIVGFSIFMGLSVPQYFYGYMGTSGGGPVHTHANWGIGWLLDGSFGTASGSTVSIENVGLLALTRSGTRRVVQTSARFMLFFAVFGKFGAILASIPLPIFAALQCISFAYESSAGLDLLQFCNLNKLRSKFIIGFSIFMGLSVRQYFNGYTGTSDCDPVHTHANWFYKFVEIIFTSPATVAAMIAVFLDCTIPPGCTDNGEIEIETDWWDAFTSAFEEDPEFYSLPLGFRERRQAGSALICPTTSRDLTPSASATSLTTPATSAVPRLPPRIPGGADPKALHQVPSSVLCVVSTSLEQRL